MVAAAGILLGLLVGLRHAFEPDHLTAVATLASETRSARRGALVGAVWGLGHTISLVAVGIALILIGDALPLRLAASFEMVVAGVLVVLGVRALARACERWPAAPPKGGAVGSTAWREDESGQSTLAWRPLAVGLVHGLAGSGALTALVFAQLPDPAARLGYIVCFGVGSIAGMAAASALAGLSLGAVPLRMRRGLSAAAGAFSIVLGVAWGIPLYAVVV